MREISEYKLLGNYLVNLYEKNGKSSIKYETIKSILENIETSLNKQFDTYQILPIEKKVELVKKMISKGVFKTNPGNKVNPFKQVYPYEVSSYIYAEYNCDGSLYFSLSKELSSNKDYTIEKIKKIYTTDSNLILQSAINKEITSLNYAKQKNKVR